MKILLILLVVLYTTVYPQSQVQTTFLTNLDLPVMASYSPEKMAELMRKNSQFVEKLAEDVKGIPIVARSYCKSNAPTASGLPVHSGVIATDSRFLKLGTKVQLFHNGRSLGRYTVLDRGDKYIKGRAIDIYTRSCRAARVFGIRRLVLKVHQVPQTTWKYRRQ